MNFEQTARSPYGPLAVSHKLVPLAELCEPKNGIQTGPFGSQLHKADYVESDGTPIITVEHLGENVVEGEDAPLVGDADLERLQKYTLKEGDIVFSRVGSVDRRALVAREQEGWLFSGRLLRVRPEPQKVDPAYLSYFFGLPAFKAYIRSVAVGATMPSLNTKLLGAVPVILPPINTQRAVGQFLADIDRKIRLNFETAGVLEGLISRTFRSWFIDFDPVKAKMTGEAPAGMDAETAALFPDSMEELELGEIPTGWRHQTLGDIALAKKGKTITRASSVEGKIPVVAGGLEPAYFHNKPNVNGPVVTISASGANAGFVRLYGQDVWASDCSFFSRSETQHVYFVYSFLKHHQDKIFGMQQGAAQPHIYGSDLARLAGNFPSEVRILDAFEKAVTPLFELQEVNRTQNSLLSEIRDALLPRLISGELEIPGEMLAA